MPVVFVIEREMVRKRCAGVAGPEALSWLQWMEDARTLKAERGRTEGEWEELGEMCQARMEFDRTQERWRNS